MAILKALTHADLQKFMHVLQEMESEGVPSLAFARQRVATELSAQHIRRMQRYARNQIKPIPCPDCGQPMMLIEADKLLQMLCKQCRYSMIVESL